MKSNGGMFVKNIVKSFRVSNAGNNLILGILLMESQAYVSKNSKAWHYLFALCICFKNIKR